MFDNPTKLVFACALLLAVVLCPKGAAADTVHYRYTDSSVNAECATNQDVIQACDRNCNETRTREMEQCVDLYLAEAPGFDLWDFAGILACVMKPASCAVVGSEQIYNWLIKNPEAWDRAKQCSADADRRAGQCILAQTSCISTVCGLESSPPRDYTEPYQQDPNPFPDGGGSGGYIVCEIVTVTDNLGNILSQGTACY